MKRLVISLVVVAVSILALSGIAVAQSAPEFKLGFRLLASQIPDIVGQPLENEHFNPANGDSLQQTSKGLMVWRKADNWTAFTNGYMTWINGPYGVQSRLNSQRFDWESDATSAPQASQPQSPIADAPDVIPILFLPPETAPNPEFMPAIETLMRRVQLWYWRELDGLTFTYQPPVLFHSSQHLVGNPFIPGALTHDEYRKAVEHELALGGYTAGPKHVLAVFTVDGWYSTGGPLVLLSGSSVLERYIGIERSNDGTIVNLPPRLAEEMRANAEVVTAHELGHAWGLVHPSDEGAPEDSLNYYAHSVMAAPFSDLMPKGLGGAVLLDSATNPEKAILKKSPFFRSQSPVLGRTSFVVPSSAPSLVSPPNAASLHADGNVTVTWDGPNGSKQYLVEYWTNSHAPENSGWIASPDFTIPLSMSVGNVINWHVKARDDFGESAWSSTWTFVIDKGPQTSRPPTPVLITPNPGEILPQDADITLRWSAVPGVVDCKIQALSPSYAYVKDWHPMAVEDHVGKIPVNQQDTFRWRVTVRNANFQESDWSSYQTFTVGNSP